MGAFLLAAGTRGMRHCLPHARVMIHQPHGSAGVWECGVCGGTVEDPCGVLRL